MTQASFRRGPISDMPKSLKSESVNCKNFSVDIPLNVSLYFDNFYGKISH